MMHSAVKTGLRLVKWLFTGIGLFLLTVALFFMVLYLWAPVYRFQQPIPFKGSRLWNPYATMDSNHWRKANFHMHSRMAGGVTDGRLNTSENIFKTYMRLGYNVFSISDYMRINRYTLDQHTYIPVYEHGYGIWKNHQLCIGSKGVSLLDYPFGQTLNDKQHVINVLKEKNEIVTIAHPEFRKGYSPEDFRFLRNYDLLEALNHYRFSLHQWDAALSSGYPACLLASDDAHDVNQPGEVGRCVTFINSPTNSATDIVTNLKAGNAFGMSVGRYANETVDSVAATAGSLPKVTTVALHHDTLEVGVNRPAEAIRFVSQRGKLRAIVKNCSRAVYPIAAADPYVRTEILFAGKHGGDSVTIYLNPIYRFNGDHPVKPAAAPVDVITTWLHRLVAICTLFFIGFNIFAIRKRRRLTAAL